MLYHGLSLDDIENYILRLLSKDDLRLLQLLIDTVYDSRNRLIFLKDDTSDSCFESIQYKTKCFIIFNYIYYNYYLITVRQYFAIVIILAALVI